MTLRHYKNTVFAGPLVSDHFEVYGKEINYTGISGKTYRQFTRNKNFMGKSEKNNYRLLLKSGSVIFEITESENQIPSLPII